MADIFKQLRLHEGEKSHPYRDTVGKLTIGVGFNLTDDGLDPTEIDFILRRRVSQKILQLNARLPWFPALDGVRQKVLVDMCYNMGIGGLMGFKNTLKAVAEGRWDDVARGMLDSKWAKQVGQRAVRLAEMMRTGRDYDTV